MKKILIIAAAVFSCMIVQAQTKGSIKIYGFQQPVLGGAAQGNIVNEKGDEVPMVREAKFNYLVYTASAATIIPVEIWLKGKAYAAAPQKVTLPVVFDNPTMIEKKILVPKSSKKVLQLELRDLKGKGNTRAKQLAASNQLVVVYKQAGKTYYQTLKKLTELEAVIMP
jgi:hypothetical protein